MHSSQVPSTVVNIESVWLGRPLSRTTLTAAATASLTDPVDSGSDGEGATENAISMFPMVGRKVEGVTLRPGWRPFATFDWNSRSCGLHGHATYAPTEPALAARLQTTTPSGHAWRCLRCGAYILGAPQGSGPANAAPIVLRGKALRDTFVLRFLAVDRGVRGFLLLALAYGVWRFDGARGALRQVLNTYLPILDPLGDKFGVDLEESGPVRLIQQALTARHSTLLLVALGVLAYGILELVEAYGLWFKKRWGEYVAVVATALFIPLEIHEIMVKVSWLRVGALIINLFAVAYILWTKRLFGFRGGHAAFEAERRNDSLLELEHAAALEYAETSEESAATAGGHDPAADSYAGSRDMSTSD
jgi:uncharacterized membrane protein (DUF2068 family)